MKLLIVLPYVPYPLTRGTFQRVYNLTEQLAGVYETDIFCLSQEPGDADQLPRFEGLARRARFSPFKYPPWPSFWTNRLWHPLPTTIRHWQSDTVLADLIEFVSGHDYDLIYFVDIVLWPYIEKLFPNHPGRIMDRSRVDWLFQREELNTLPDTRWGKFMRRENLFKMVRYEKRALQQLRLEVVCGEDDKTFLESRLGPLPNLFVLPNGANTQYFDAEQWPPKPTDFPSAVFCGALDYTPNSDGLHWYFQHIHDSILEICPAYRLFLVGKNPGPDIRHYADTPGVEFVGEVPDVRPYYQKAWFQIVPLRIGGGTRLKIAEGLAMENPVVSTTIGAQGIELASGRDILLADQPEDFAAACLRMINDENLRRNIAKSGRTRILDAYTWPALAKRLTNRIASS